MSYVQCAKNTTTQPSGSPQEWHPSTTGKAGNGSTSTFALSVGDTVSPATTAERSDPRQYAKERTYAQIQAEDARAYYQRKAQEQLEGREKQLQAQVNERYTQAQAAIDKAMGEAEHWKEQAEIMYGLMTDNEQRAAAEIAELTRQVTRLQKEVDRLRSLRSNAGKAKRLMNRE